MTKYFSNFLFLILLFSLGAFAQEDPGLHQDDLGATQIFCHELDNHFVDKKVLSSKDLIGFIKIIDLENKIANPIPEARSRINFKNAFAFKKFRDLIEKNKLTLDLEKIRACANNLLDESERVEKKRKERSRKTRTVISDIPQSHMVLGRGFSCALNENFQIQCWGSKDLSGKFGGRLLRSIYSSSGIDLYVCALDANMKPLCVSTGRFDDIGDNSGIYKWLTMYQYSTICGLSFSDEFKCWGSEPYLGAFGLRLDKAHPILHQKQKIKKAVFGFSHGCILLEDRSVQCWGDYKYKDFPAPKGLEDVQDIFAGGEDTCAIIGADRRRVTCWYPSFMGGASAYDLSQGNPVKKIALAESYKCILNAENNLSCWGRNSDLAKKSSEEIGKVKDVFVGQAHACAVLENNKLTCWGQSRDGEIKVPEGFISVLANEDDGANDD